MNEPLVLTRPLRRHRLATAADKAAIKDMTETDWMPSEQHRLKRHEQLMRAEKRAEYWFALKMRTLWWVRRVTRIFKFT